MIDIMFGFLMVVISFMLRRIFILFDKLHEEDKILHNRINDLSTHAVTRVELNGAIDRVISRIEKMEERVLNVRH